MQSPASNQDKIPSPLADSPAPSEASRSASTEQLFTPDFDGASLSTLQNQNRHMELMVQRNNVFLRLGRSLSCAESAREAAQIIVDAASELFHWDACNLNLYNPESHTIDQLYIADSFEGRRKEIEPTSEFRPSPLYAQVLVEGAKLLLRTPEEVISPPTVAFGNSARRSASLMFVPLRQGEKNLGLFTFQSYSFNAYTEEDLQTLQSLADHCSGTLRRLRADQERKRTEERNLVLLQLGKNLSSARTPKDAAEIIVNGASQLFSWDACTIDLYLPDEDVLVPLFVVDTIEGEKRTITNGPSLPPSSLARRVLENGSTLILRTPEQLSHTDGLSFGSKRLSASLMYVCIRQGEKIVGILSFQSYALKAYDERDLRVLELVADYCGGALERIRIETNLRNSEVRFHSVWESSADGMRITDEKGTIVAVNQAYCKLVGTPRHEIEGKPFTTIYESSDRLKEALVKYQIRFAKRILQRQVTRRMKFRSGKVVDLEDTTSFIESNDGRTLLLALFRDVTAQKQLEEELRQSQKMESVGQLAGGIAHDFNNILTVIGGHASLLLMQDESLSENARESIEQIATSSERAANLTRQLLAFSRKQMMQAHILHLNDVVNNMTKILQRVLGEHICLHVCPSSDIPTLYADGGMLEQVLLNLAVNARDAMPNGGSLVISTSVEKIDESNSRNPEIASGEFVCLRVQDTGCGIPHELLPKIFDPFFTTKDVGKGTGLGLATVYGIVKQHGGFIKVSSEVERGTTFHVYFPQASGSPLSGDSSQPETSVAGGSETILIVEDEEGVRMLVASMLKRLGYRCLEAASGVQALNLWNEYSAIIDLVITDIVMPDGMSGWDLARKLLSVNSKTKIVFSSGYPRESVGEPAAFENGINFLQKPYPPEALARIVRETLDNTSVRI